MNERDCVSMNERDCVSMNVCAMSEYEGIWVHMSKQILDIFIHNG